VGFGIKTLSSGIGGAKKLVHKTLAYPAFLLSGLPFRHIRPDTRESTVYVAILSPERRLKSGHKNSKQTISKCVTVQIFGNNNNKSKFDLGGN
jgi:hypothetical protein